MRASPSLRISYPAGGQRDLFLPLRFSDITSVFDSMRAHVFILGRFLGRNGPGSEMGGTPGGRVCKSAAPGGNAQGGQIVPFGSNTTFVTTLVVKFSLRGMVCTGPWSAKCCGYRRRSFIVLEIVCCCYSTLVFHSGTNRATQYLSLSILWPHARKRRCWWWQFFFTNTILRSTKNNKCL